MSKKCKDRLDDKICEGKTCRGRSQTRRSLSRASRCNEKSSERREFSLRTVKPRRTCRGAKNCSGFSNRCGKNGVGPFVKETRAEDSPGAERDTRRGGTFASTKRVKIHEWKGAKKKTNRNRSECRNKKKHEKSSVCSRLIDVLFKCCSCLKSLDSSATSCPCIDNNHRYCCSRYKCHVHTPKCHCISVQCDDYERYFATNLSRRKNNELRESTNKVSSHFLTSESRIEKSGSTCVKCKNNFRPVAREIGPEDAVNFRPNDRLRRDKSSDNKTKNFRKKSPVSMKSRSNKRRRISGKSLICEGGILDEHIAAVSSHRCSCFCDDRTTFVPCSKKRLKFQDTQEERVVMDSRCNNDDCRKTISLLLLIMFDVVFWPYTCFPGRRYNKNKNKNCVT